MATKTAATKKAVVVRKVTLQNVESDAELSDQTPKGYIFRKKDLEEKTIEQWMDVRIYRIFPIGRLIQALTSKKLTLVKPKLWDDPFENALLASKFMLGNMPATVLGKDSVYGQCWTLLRETDAMWRIYSHSKDGVRVQTTPRKLLEAMKSKIPNRANERCFIGKVGYFKKQAIANLFVSVDIGNPDGTGVAKSLLLKRPEFEHEEEVRLIYNAENEDNISDIFSFDISPNEIFDSILFDPRMDEELRKAYKKTISSLGCEVPFKRSTLYDPPERLTYKLKKR